jgi:hypothetical protein
MKDSRLINGGALGINRKRVYNGLERIKMNFRLVSHAHFHHFMTAGPRLARSRRSCQLYARAKPARQRRPHRDGGKSFILFE